MAFHEIQFPTDISYGSKGGPTFKTDIIVVGHGPEYLVDGGGGWTENIIQSGYEQRNINWRYSKNEYDVAYGITTGEQLQALIAFFQARWGRLHGFRYKDWSDYKAVDGECFKIDATHFQINKTYKSENILYTPLYPYVNHRKITKPVVGTATNLWINHYPSTIEYNTNWTLDCITGILTFSPAPTFGINDHMYISFEFDTPVRFDTDQLLASLDNYNAAGTYFGGASAPLIEIRI